jgi:hypothetical protein
LNSSNASKEISAALRQFCYFLLMSQWLQIGIGLIAGGALILGVLFLSLRPLLSGMIAPSSGGHDSGGSMGLWGGGDGDSSGCGDGGSSCQ